VLRVRPVIGVEDIKAAVFISADHIVEGGAAIDIVRCFQHPRLERIHRYDFARTQKTTRSWRVDGRLTSKLDQALAWLNAPAPEARR